MESSLKFKRKKYSKLFNSPPSPYPGFQGEKAFLGNQDRVAGKDIQMLCSELLDRIVPITPASIQKSMPGEKTQNIAFLAQLTDFNADIMGRQVLDCLASTEGREREVHYRQCKILWWNKKKPSCVSDFFSQLVFILWCWSFLNFNPQGKLPPPPNRLRYQAWNRKFGVVNGVIAQSYLSSSVASTVSCGGILAFYHSKPPSPHTSYVNLPPTGPGSSGGRPVCALYWPLQIMSWHKFCFKAHLWLSQAAILFSL